MKQILPVISIVVPTYNEEKYIKLCLDSLHRQSLEPAEIIVVDNNSTDRTIEIVKKFTDVKIINEKRQGQMFARHTGFNIASGALLATVDADTIADDNWLSEMSLALEEKQVDALSCYTVLRDSGLHKRFSSFASIVGFAANKFSSGHNGLYGSSLIVKDSAWTSVESELHVDQTVWEDIDLSCALNKNGYRIGLLREALVSTSFRRSKSSIKDNYTYFYGWSKAYSYYNKFATIAIYVFSIMVIIGMSLIKIFKKTDNQFTNLHSGNSGAVVR